MNAAARALVFLISFFFLVIVLFLVLVVVVPGRSTSMLTATSTASTLSVDALAASSTVVAFGREEQLTELNAPDASAQVKKNYGRYVVASLLSQWQSDTESAPGRVVSSPWPDHIVVDSLIKTSNGYQVKASLVLMTSNGVFGTDPLIIDLVKHDGAWLISSYQDLSAG